MGERRERDITLRSQLVAPVLAFVRERGGDADRLLRELALPGDAESAPEVRLPLRKLRAFFEAAEAEVSDPFLGLHVAQSFRRGTWGLLEYGGRSAATVRESLGRVARYSELFNEHVRVTFEEGGGKGTIAQSIPGRPECLGRHGNEFFAAAIVTQLNALTGANLSVERAFFAHRKPPSISEHRAIFGRAAIEFGVDRNGVVLDERALDLPLGSADPTLLALLDGYAKKALDDRTRSGDADADRMSAQIREVIRATLAAGERPTLAATARALSISERTFQRRLSDEGTTFADLLDSVREDLARTYARDPTVPISGIAFMLGYAELSPFLRAFKRWTGQSPRAFRVKEGRRT